MTVGYWREIRPLTPGFSDLSVTKVDIYSQFRSEFVLQTHQFEQADDLIEPHENVKVPYEPYRRRDGTSRRVTTEQIENETAPRAYGSVRQPAGTSGHEDTAKTNRRGRDTFIRRERGPTGTGMTT